MQHLKKNWFYILLILIVFIALVKQCEAEPRIVTKTETITKYVTDTITKVEIKEVPKTVFVEKYITEKGDEKIVFVKDSTKTSIKANQHDTKLTSNDATAELKITTTGELLDVTGVITYPLKETTTTITKTRDASGLFIYANLPINNFSSPEVGALYQFKNTVFISGGVQYNNLTNMPDFKVGIGLKIF
jgi:hypothetical protein